MFRSCFLAMALGLVALSSDAVAQDPKKSEPKTEDKKVEPPVRYKGVLPAHWRKLGLTEAQVQEVYKAQTKYNEEIAKLKAKIKELEAAKEKEEKAVLTPEQQKRLIDILLGKDN